jgi:uncharacterized membrane protein
VPFVRLHIVWFAVWIAVNLGLLGAALTFDLYPFGLLTLVVSLEAIFLSTFVMISQNRQAAVPEIRSELDYRTNMMAEREIDPVMKALERLARQQGIEVADLVDELAAVRETLRHDAGRASACGERQGVTPVCVITGFATARAFLWPLRLGTGKAVGR